MRNQMTRAFYLIILAAKGTKPLNAQRIAFIYWC